MYHRADCRRGNRADLVPAIQCGPPEVREALFLASPQRDLREAKFRDDSRAANLRVTMPASFRPPHHSVCLRQDNAELDALHSRNGLMRISKL